MHETPSRDRGDGRATGQPQGLEPEAYLFSTSQGSRPEDARKDGQIRGRSRWFVHNAGWQARHRDLLNCDNRRRANVEASLRSPPAPAQARSGRLLAPRGEWAPRSTRELAHQRAPGKDCVSATAMTHRL